MAQNAAFLRSAGLVVKVAAWIVLFLGVAAGLSVLLGFVSADIPRWAGAVILAVYTFMFFVLFLIATMASVLAKIITEEK